MSRESSSRLGTVGDLNSSQENVLTAIKKKDALVVQGPPGTGKSQTITSLIADAVHNGQNVLMVSEKKAALDVVYSRLGDLNKYAMMLDDINDKQSFYAQMEAILVPQHGNGPSAEQIFNVASQIDSNVSQLECIAKKLYEPNEYGIEVYKLYLKNRRYDLSDPTQMNKYKQFKAVVSASILALKYSQLSTVFEKFTDCGFLCSCAEYSDVVEKAQWLLLMRTDLTEYELFELEEITSRINDEIKLWKSKNFIARILTRGKLSEFIYQRTAKFFLINQRSLLEFFLQDQFDAKKLSLYSSYVNTKPLFESLTNLEREYLKALIAISHQQNVELSFANNELLNFIVCEYLFDFESKNREVLQFLYRFTDIIHALSVGINEKKVLSKRMLFALLQKELLNVNDSKRNGEINRIVESKRKWSVNRFMKKFSFELFRGIRIWLMTPEVASEILPLQTGLFDLVIFDEASQMYIEKGVPSILRAKKVVIAGDNKQLRPSSLGSGRIETDEDLIEETDSNAALEEESLLDIARFRYSDSVLLNYHYRSKYEELIAFSNYAFYRGRLYVSPNVCPAKQPPIRVYKIEDGLWAERRNYAEAKKVVCLLKNFFEQRAGNETIGIITFNSAQRDLIEDLIDDECSADQGFATRIKSEISRKENGQDIGLFVRNIENVQGDERDMIIFSIGYAKNSDGRLIRNFGWLNQKGGENRLNVAITRARERVIIVTSFNPSELQVEDALNEGPRILKKYLQYCFAVSSNDKKAAQEILLSFGDKDVRSSDISFDSDFENQVYDALRDKGLSVDTQIGIGGYSIDLAIRKDDKYVLGIECDGKLYHISKSARERDFHRQKYLEERGWRIHRIWSTNWWRNPDNEIRKIINIVSSVN